MRVYHSTTWAQFLIISPFDLTSGHKRVKYKPNMTDDQNNQHPNQNKEKRLDSPGDIATTPAGESLSLSPFLTGPAKKIEYPTGIAGTAEQYGSTNQVPLPQSPTEPISITATQPTSGDVASRIENIKAFLRTQANIPSQGLNELFSTAASATPEEQTPFIEPVSYNPKTYFGHVQQRSERLLKKAA